MHEIIQRIPGGCLTPEEQVVLALEAIQSAADFLAFSGRDELEAALLDMHDPLELLVGAGVLSEIRFSLTDSHGVCSVRAILDPYAVEDYEEVDLSGLRLLANSEACATIEIVCPDIVFAAEIAGTEWVPEATDLLTCALATQSDSDTDEEMPSPTLEDEEEERDDDEYESQSWRESDGEDGDLYH